jgi:hypothetical protein
MKGIALSLLACAVAPLFFAGCARDQPRTEDVALPDGPCRDDENLVDGRCATRFPGDGAPHNPNPPIPR